MPKLEHIVHTALDELRMQMLGAQVLFGFQMQGVFQQRYEKLPSFVKQADGGAFALMVLTIGLLLAPACHHRLVERGQARQRLLAFARPIAQIALITFAAAIGLDVFVILQPYLHTQWSLFAGEMSIGLALILWFGIGAVLRMVLPGKETSMSLPPEEKTSLHEKVDQMLTEARIILPGAQALLGFQFVVTMTEAFARLPTSDRTLHFLALAAVAITIGLLLTPASIHRLTFNGCDTDRFHRIGSILVTAALAPLALGISLDFYVSSSKMFQAPSLAAGIAALAGVTLLVLWYFVPMLIRARLQKEARQQGA